MENIDDLYVDQAPHRSRYLYRAFFSTYLPYGLKSIESSFISRILNINEPIKQVYDIVRRPQIWYNSRTGLPFESMNYETHYDEIDPYDLKIGYGKRVVWENGSERDIHHGGNDVLPKVDFKTKMDNPQLLWYEIYYNPHLHDKIKENLLYNLENIYNG
jgi:hypothetical protein